MTAPSEGNPIAAILGGVVRPLLVAVVVAGAGVAGWWFLSRAEDRAIERLVDIEARLVASLTRGSLDRHLEEVQKLARRWERRTAPDSEEWKADVLDAKQQTPALRAIEWRDASLALRWSAPLTAVGPGADLDSTYDDRRRAAITAAATSEEGFVSSSYIGSPEHRHIAFVVPMYEGQAVSGYLVGIARVRDLLDGVLHDELKHGYSIAVHEGPYLVYGPHPMNEGAAAENYSWSADMLAGDLLWQMEVWPGPNLVGRLRSPVPLVMLTVALVAGVLAGAAASGRRS